MTIPTDVAISRRGKFLVQVHFIDSLYSYLLSCPCDDDNALHLIIHSLTRTCSPPSPCSPVSRVPIPIDWRKYWFIRVLFVYFCCPRLCSAVRTRPVYLLRVQGSDTVTTGIGLESMSHAPGDSMRCSNEGSAYNYNYLPTIQSSSSHSRSVGSTRTIFNYISWEKHRCIIIIAHPSIA